MAGCVHSNLSIVIGKVGVLYKKPTGPNTARTFEFGKRKLTENDTGMTLDESAINRLNTIQLELVWGTRGRLKIRKTFKYVQDVGPIDEKSNKKGPADAAKLGKTIFIDRSKSRAFQPDPTLKKTVFIFKYAPESWLRAEGIIPNDSHIRNYIDVDVLDQDTKAEPDTKSGIVRRSMAHTRVFWDSEGEIEVLKHLAPVPLHGNQAFGIIKAENEGKVELKVEAKIEIEIDD
ncbi:unnamed protein product [Rhizoctonia solani]|uniref:Uncharacterized protein n=1 Tax=Rhizoctonia solani TaxID=456999 RepID=A0A8H2XD42_9AGAM|nr:unnamed protein product [Rhizoctonia solani]